MIEILQFVFSGFWRFCGTIFLIVVIGYWLSVIVDAFTPFYGLRKKRKKKAIEITSELMKWDSQK